jgi:hypothetical protein
MEGVLPNDEHPLDGRLGGERRRPQAPQLQRLFEWMHLFMLGMFFVRLFQL